MSYSRTMDTYTVVKLYELKTLADNNQLINIDLADENGKKVHTVAYSKHSDVDSIDNLAEYIDLISPKKGTKIIAKVVDTNNPTTKMMTYFALGQKEFSY